MGKGIWTYTTNLSDDAYEELYFGRRGKGKGRGEGVGKRSTGKGSGRQQNPIVRDGEILKCSVPNCQSTTRLARNCPRKGKGTCSSSSSSKAPGSNPAYITDYMGEIHMINVEEEQPTPTRTREQIDDRREELIQQLRELEAEVNALLTEAQPAPPAATDMAASAPTADAPSTGIHPHEVAAKLLLLGRSDMAALMGAPTGAPSAEASRGGSPSASPGQPIDAATAADSVLPLGQQIPYPLNPFNAEYIPAIPRPFEAIALSKGPNDPPAAQLTLHCLNAIHHMQQARILQANMQLAEEQRQYHIGKGKGRNNGSSRGGMLSASSTSPAVHQRRSDDRHCIIC